MGAVVAGDEEEQIAGGRVERGLDGAAAGIADGAGGQAFVLIGVVGGWVFEVAAVEVSVKSFAEAIDCCRVTGETHFAF